MNKLLALAIVLALLLPEVLTQCSAYCQICYGAFNYAYDLNCSSCPTSFINASPNGCAIDPTVYLPYAVMQVSDGTLIFNNTNTSSCGSLFSANVPGMFTPT
jgi:hypothetical protein